MRARHAMMMVGAAFLAWSAPAQGQCSTALADACAKAQDIFHFMTPQISTALAGGSTTLGQGGVLGGMPHWTVALRASAVQGAFPEVGDLWFSTTNKQVTNLPSKSQLVPMASLDGAIGLYEGFPLGVTRVGGVDLLLTATFLPKPSSGSGDVQIDLPGGSTKFGYGVRVGLLQESLVVPGVSFSWVKRGLPTIAISGASITPPGGSLVGGTFTLENLDIKTSSWRISASKSFVLFGIEGGLGQDKYDNSAGALVTVQGQSQRFDVSNSMNRTNIYAGLTMNIFIGKLVGEVGQVSGGSVPALFNTIDESHDASKGRSYFSLGFRTGF